MGIKGKKSKENEVISIMLTYTLTDITGEKWFKPQFFLKYLKLVYARGGGQMTRKGPIVLGALANLAAQANISPYLLIS